jgi:hypothetical protein
MSQTGPGFGVEDLNLTARMQRVFYAPRSAFEAVRGLETAHDWLLPALLVCLVGLVAHYLTLDVVTDLQSPAAQRQLEGMDEAARKQYEESAAMLRASGWMMIPVGVFTSLVIVAMVLKVMARSLFQADVSYRQMLVVKAYAALVVGVEWVLRAVLVLATGDPGVHLGPGMLLPEGVAASFTGRVLLTLNFFDLWQIGIMGVGLSAMTDAPIKKTCVALLMMWLFWLVGGAVMETISRNLVLPPRG